MIFKNKQDEILNYISDAANYKGYCDGVYFPVSTEEVSGLLREANKSKTPVTVAGNGTGLTGARVPEGGVVLSTEKINKIITHQDRITVQPGVILSDLQKYLESINLFYPPDPTERNCFLGGTVATNASGAGTFKYGSTRDYILGLEVVLATGDVINLKRGKLFADNLKLEIISDNGNIYKLNLPDIVMPSTKNAAGYYIKPYMDAIDLFIGSEGTLGVITKADLKVLPLPDSILSAVIFFSNEDDALNFLISARDISLESEKNGNINDVQASGLEFFDKYALEFLRSDYPNIPESFAAAVWFEQDNCKNMEETISTWTGLIKKHHGDLDNSWLAANRREREEFKEFRHAVSWKVNEFVASRGLKKVGTDTAVPGDNFLIFYRYIKELVVKSGIKFLIYGHFGNSHPHLNMLPETETEYAEAVLLYKKICSKAVELGGTVSAEHGIGKMKRQYLLEMYGEEKLRKMAAVKKELDPNLILGIGNIFDPELLQ